MGYQRWYLRHIYAIATAGAYASQWLQNFREFPPSQKPGSFNLERVMEAVTRGAGDGRAAKARAGGVRKQMSGKRNLVSGA